jgi:peptidoglycan hydrolase-like protein with peptidoglycan-binding domain
MGGLVLVVGGAGLVSADTGAARLGTTVVGQAAADAGAVTTTVAPDPTTSTSTSTTEETTTTITTEPAPPPDPSVVGLQRRLAELGYDIGDPDGGFGWRTYYSVMAFQKVEGLERTGADGPEVRAALARASRPGPIVPGGEPTRVEIDLERQVLFLWQDGRLARILSVSTGSGQHYCVGGDCDVAVTPTGTFHIGRKYPGVEVSRLGQLFHPMYFYGGIAIHGSPSVPGHPASHGCVRVPMYAAASLYDQVPAGTPVHVEGNAPSAAAVAPPPDEPVRPANQAPPPEPVEPPPTKPAATTTPPTVPAPASSTTVAS